MPRDTREGTPALTVSVTPEFTKLNREAPAETHVLVNLTGRQTDETETRKPLRIAIAADLSGSMSGSKLDYLQASLQALVEQLGPEDEMAIIAFSTDVWTVASPTRCTASGRQALAIQIDQMRTSACTNLSGGALRAIQTLRDMMRDPSAAGASARVFLLTDGLANTGISRHEELVPLLGRTCGEDVTLSTFGYSFDDSPYGGGYDPELLTSIANACGGNFYHVGQLDGIAESLAVELGSLAAVAAQAVTVRIEPRPGVTVNGVLNDVRMHRDDTGATIELTGIATEDEKAIVFRAGLPTFNRSVAGARPRKKVMTIVVEWVDARTGEPCRSEHPLNLEFVAPANADTRPDPLVEKQAALLRAAREQHEAMQCAGHGDFDRAQSILRACLESIRRCALFNEDAELQHIHRLLDGLAKQVVPQEFGEHVFRRGTAARRGMMEKKMMFVGETQSPYARKRDLQRIREMKERTEKLVHLKEEQIRLYDEESRIEQRLRENPGDPDLMTLLDSVRARQAELGQITRIESQRAHRDGGL